MYKCREGEDKEVKLVLGKDTYVTATAQE